MAVFETRDRPEVCELPGELERPKESEHSHRAALWMPYSFEVIKSKSASEVAGEDGCHWTTAHAYRRRLMAHSRAGRMPRIALS